MSDRIAPMDLSDALFSPSKARQQQAQAKDWIFVDSWLSKKYHPKPVPAFERDEETLQALMTLVAFNERADEEQALVARVERQALNELDGKVGDAMFQLSIIRPFDIAMSSYPGAFTPFLIVCQRCTV